MSSPCWRKKPSSIAAIAGKYEFEIMSGTASFTARPSRSCQGAFDPCRNGNERGIAMLESHHLQAERQPVGPEQRQRDARSSEQRGRNRKRGVAGGTEAERRRPRRRQGDAGVALRRERGVK